MKYIVAVSGGLDSVALLHMLNTMRLQDTSVELVVAHVDHGIRDDSDADAWHVATLAQRYGLPFEVTRLTLGDGPSEEQARTERYRWLEQVRAKHRADGIVTAHHQDDQLETIALNFMRGTGWRGLASVQTSDGKFRPLLDLPKVNLVRYALDHGLVWREDSTNQDLRLTRNYVRHAVIPKLGQQQRQQLAGLAVKQRALRHTIEQEVAELVAALRTDLGLDRYKLIMMPDPVVLEVLRHVTRGIHEPFQIRRLLHFVKTGRQGSVLNLGRGKNALLTKRYVII